MSRPATRVMWSALPLLLALPVISTASEVAADAPALARLIEGHRIVLLGEVHDNDVQHALRAKALARVVAAGKRPALAFEQFDVERQPDIDRARRERPGDPDYLIGEAKSRGNWNWNAYRPFVALALAHDLPIVAANLSRRRAMEVASVGWSAVFDASTRHALKLDTLPVDYLRAHASAIDRGHCNRLPADALPAMARAQIARDIVMAQKLRPYAARGVVLLAGNGHVRKDVGVPFWLTPDERREAVSIGALEQDDDASDAGARYDAWFVTASAPRPDPCKDMGPLPAFTRPEAREHPRN